jgi:glycine betaine/proline transport system substrate-binding protein
MRLNRMGFRKWFIWGAVIVMAVLLCAPSAMAAKEKIIFGDMSWDSAMVHNRIVAFIIEKGMGYPQSEFVPGGTPIMVQSLMRGDIDIDMESWTQNIQELYDKGIKEGTIIDLGPNFPDSWQGWLVPTFVIKGDEKRGIKPMAPDLKSVTDMPKYAKLFKDPEDPSKGRFYNAIAGWGVTEINEKKFKAYGLDKTFNQFVSGSDAALSGSMVAAYEKGNPWFGYYWGPTWVLGKLDMTPLEEPKYDKAVWEKNYACEFPSVDVNIIVNSKLPKRAPDVIDLLKKYETNMKMNNEILAWMKDNRADAEAAAEYFLKNYEDVWTKWVAPEVADKVKAALK